MTFLAMPTEAADWPEFLVTYCSPRLRAAHAGVETLRNFPTDDAQAWVDTWNTADVALDEVATLTELIAETHPDKAVRRTADGLLSEAKTFAMERFQERAVFEGLAKLDASTLEPGAAEVVRRLDGDFRAQGAHLSEDERATLADLNRTITRLTNEFSEHVRDSMGSIKITPEQLKESITEKSRALLINSPGNPTGITYSPEELDALSAVLGDLARGTAAEVPQVEVERLRKQLFRPKS